MQLIQVQSILKFSQWNIKDIREGGHCGSYTSLFLNYVSLAYLKNPNKLDYAAFSSILIGFELRTELKNHFQNEYISKSKCYKNILDCETAILSNNEELNPYYHSYHKTRPLQDFCHMILKDISEFKEPIFYTLHVYDESQKLFGEPLNHLVGFYLFSPTELHMFDANSGVNILHLPNEVLFEDLENNIKQLLFKNTLINKWVTNVDSEGMVFNSLRSKSNANLSERCREIKDYLEVVMNDSTKIDDTFVKGKEKNFIDVNLYIISKQYELNKVKAKYSYNFFDFNATTFNQISDNEKVPSEPQVCTIS